VRRLRRAGLSLLVLLGACAVVALLLEGVLRLMYRVPLAERFYAPSADLALAYTLQPSRAFRYRARGGEVLVTTDAAGRRVVPGAPARAAHTLHVIGDSQVFGWDLNDDETVPAGLQRRLGADWRVMNHGVPGYGPHAYAALLARVPTEDLALVVLTETNDLRDAFFDTPEATARCGFLVSDDLLGRHLPCFALGSYSFAAGILALHRFGDSRLLVPLGFDPLAEAAATMLRFRIETILATRGGGQARAREGHLLMAVVPWDVALLPARHVYYTPDLPRPQRLVALAADVDLEAAFRRHDHPERLFLAADHHLSAAGAALVADELAPRVAAMANHHHQEGGLQ
jgi:lysophospholipase L1-like esterase